MNSWAKESESFRRFHMQRQTVQSQPLEDDDARRSGSKKVWIETEHTATAEIGKVLLQIYRNATCPVIIDSPGVTPPDVHFVIVFSPFTDGTRLRAT